MTLQRRLKYFFFILWVTIFGDLLLVDIIKRGSTDTMSVFTYSVLGSLFLAQCLAAIVTALYILKSRFKTSTNNWKMFAVATLISVTAAVIFFYQGPRIVTESDGQSSIRYFCVYGELYGTAVNKEFVCVLKNMPLAVSNIAINQKYIHEWIPPYEQIVGFGFLEVVTFGSYKALTYKKYKSSNKLD